jgi:hypothetical protein
VGYGHRLRAFGAPGVVGVAALACIALTFALAAPAEAAGPSVGMVSRVQNAGTVVTDGNAVTAKVGTVVHMEDSVQTGSGGRMEVTFRDGTKVTLGENANIVIDKYVFDPDRGVGEASLNVTEGAFRFVTGRMKEMSNKSITVTTTAAQIGVRGTNFIGGTVAGKYGVYVFSGAIEATAQGASVVVPAGQGTFIPLGGAPGAPAAWTAEQIAQILDTIGFQPGGGGQPQEPPQQQQYEQQQQQGGQQQAGTTPTTPPTYLVVPVVVGGVVVGVVVGTSNNNDNNNNEGGRGPSSP